MRTIRYRRHEFRGNPKSVKGTLLSFIYDVPYLPACGVFPPRHILNEVLRAGGGDGGMSPGASWEPFELSEAEYAGLVVAVSKTDPASLADVARYTDARLITDPAFDSIQTPEEWMAAVCAKHRSEWFERRGR